MRIESMLESIAKHGKRVPNLSLSYLRTGDVYLAPAAEKHRVTLPKEYRTFLTSLGNGGAGPFYGILRLGLETRR
jgi:hypothetical protein